MAYATRSVLKLLGLGVLCLTSPAWSETLQIAGPDGPLEATLSDAPGSEDLLIILPGSGPINRDGNSPDMQMETNLYRDLGEGLAGLGLSSLRVDKRGFFGSSGAVADPSGVTPSGYAEDAEAWIAEGLARGYTCVWLVGHSEGGLVALLTAARAPDGLCGLVLLATPGRPLDAIIAEQLAANPWTASSVPDASEILARVADGEITPIEDVPAQLHGILNEPAQRWLALLLQTPPGPLAEGYRGPTLVLQGDADIQITPEDAELLAAAMPQADLNILDAATHMLKEDIPGAPFATYLSPDYPLHPGLLPAISSFIAAH